MTCNVLVRFPAAATDVNFALVAIPEANTEPINSLISSKTLTHRWGHGPS